MGAPFQLGGDSTSKQIEVNPTGGSQATFGKGAFTANPGSTVLGRDAHLNLGLEILNAAKKVRIGKNATLTIDASTPQASSDPALIAALASLANNNSSPAPVTPPAATTPGASPTPDTRSLGQKISDSVKDGLAKLRGFVLKDNTDGTTTINTEALLFIAVFAVIFFLLKKFVFRK
jgi:hypothetical protein